jgi:hypothetical protein
MKITRRHNPLCCLIMCTLIKGTDIVESFGPIRGLPVPSDLETRDPGKDGKHVTSL